MGALVVSRDRGREIRAPTLIAVGTGDPLLPQSREIAAWWPSAQLRVIPGANHADVIVRPEVLGAIRETIRAGATPRPGSSR